MSPHTRRAYETAWRGFDAWCTAHRRKSLPCTPQTLALYAAFLARTRKVASIEAAIAAIAKIHCLAGHESPRRHPLVRMELQGIRKAIGQGAQGQDALSLPQLHRLLETPTCDPATLRGLRNRALLLLCFAGAFRRSELAALDIENFAEDPGGLRLQLRRSKADPDGRGLEKGIPFGEHQGTCPVRAVKAWLAAAGIEAGAVFVSVNRHGAPTGRRLSDKDVNRIVKEAAGQAVLDLRRLSAHSLRSGLATEAAVAGKPADVILRQTGHMTAAMLRIYIKRAKLFDNNAAADIGL